MSNEILKPCRPSDEQENTGDALDEQKKNVELTHLVACVVIVESDLIAELIDSWHLQGDADDCPESGDGEFTQH